MLSTTGDDNIMLRHRAAMGGRTGRRESETRRDLERMHLMTIRREKMRLQQELERVREKGHHGTSKRRVNNASINAKMLSNRFGSISDSGVEEPRAKMRLGTANTDRRGKSPYGSRRNISTAGHGEKDSGLPAIGLAGPLKNELEMRRLKDEQNDPNTKLLELKKNEGRQKNLLSLRVDQFTRSLTPVSPARSPARSPLHSPIVRLESKSMEGGDLDSATIDQWGDLKEDGLDTRGTFPPQNRRKGNRMSLAEFDVSDAKFAISKRLMSEDVNANFDAGVTRSDEGLPQVNVNAMPLSSPRRPSIIRRQSQVAILERSESKVNKYAVPRESLQMDPNAAIVNGINAQGATKKSAESELNLAVLGRDAKRVKEIIKNPEIAFDQERYAPDGALRTMHMLPDADSAYAQARQARYLRWRDPVEVDLDRELSIHEIFSKGKVGR
ncbi:uncharacterized protein [Diadema antillarum]|uniref:uncharacterized protein n=1 Tax=Diadema antillarum TaxID=105358 RepID=UPI003A8C4945